MLQKFFDMRVNDFHILNKTRIANLIDIRKIGPAAKGTETGICLFGVWLEVKFFCEKIIRFEVNFWSLLDEILDYIFYDRFRKAEAFWLIEKLVTDWF